jgi:hypothetical protein
LVKPGGNVSTITGPSGDISPPSFGPVTMPEPPEPPDPPDPTMMLPPAPSPPACVEPNLDSDWDPHARHTGSNA